MARARNKPTARSQRINFRASAHEERLIRLGAKKRGEKVTRFIVESACSAAEIALADEQSFQLSPAQFARFTAALDRPGNALPALQSLFSEKSAIERSADQGAPISSRRVNI